MRNVNAIFAALLLLGLAFSATIISGCKKDERTTDVIQNLLIGKWANEYYQENIEFSDSTIVLKVNSDITIMKYTRPLENLITYEVTYQHGTLQDSLGSIMIKDLSDIAIVLTRHNLTLTQLSGEPDKIESSVFHEVHLIRNQNLEYKFKHTRFSFTADTLTTWSTETDTPEMPEEWFIGHNTSVTNKQVSIHDKYITLSGQKKDYYFYNGKLYLEGNRPIPYFPE